MGAFYLPSNSQSILLIGKNGSGKTRAAVWHLAQKELAYETWIVINHKREGLINSIPGAKFLGLDERPKGPGVYIYQPKPEFDDETVTAILWWVYENENIGVYIDEGYMISPRDPALNSLYTQGRSKHIPIITLSQRPTRISRFAVSEAAFLQVFYLVDKRDRKTIQEFMPIDMDSYMMPKDGSKRILQDYHSIYYDTGGDEPFIMQPVPSDDVILDIFQKKLISENDNKSLAQFKFI